MLHRCLLKMFVKIFSGNCVPFVISYTSFPGVYMFVCTRSQVSDRYYFINSFIVLTFPLLISVIDTRKSITEFESSSVTPARTSHKRITEKNEYGTNME
jgi:hypothetical protein